MNNDLGDQPSEFHERIVRALVSGEPAHLHVELDADEDDVTVRRVTLDCTEIFRGLVDDE